MYDLSNIRIYKDETSSFIKFSLYDNTRPYKKSSSLIITANGRYLPTSGKLLRTEISDVGFYCFHNRSLKDECFSLLRKITQTKTKVYETIGKGVTFYDYNLSDYSYGNFYYSSESLNKQDYIVALLLESYLYEKENVYGSQYSYGSLLLNEVPDILILKNSTSLFNLLNDKLNSNYKSIFCNITREELGKIRASMTDNERYDFPLSSQKKLQIEKSVIEKLKMIGIVKSYTTSGSSYSVSGSALSHPSSTHTSAGSVYGSLGSAYTTTGSTYTSGLSSHSYKPSSYISIPISYTSTPSSYTSTPSSYTSTPSSYTSTPSSYTSTPSSYTSTPSSYTSTPSSYTSTPSSYTSTPSSYTSGGGVSSHYGGIPYYYSGLSSSSSTSSSKKSSKYTRFWDIHISGSSGKYDFVNDIGSQKSHQETKYNNLKNYKNYIIASSGKHIRPAPITSSLPNEGYITSCITTTDILSHIYSRENRDLVDWVSDNSCRGKIRINCHGDGNGKLGMEHEYFFASDIAQWLINCGLHNAVFTKRGEERANGLITVNLAACMVARYDVVTAKFSSLESKTSYALDSAIDRFVKEMRTNGHYGLAVTGSSEIVCQSGGKIYRSLPKLPICFTENPYMDLNNGYDYWRYYADKHISCFEKYGSNLGFTVPSGWQLTNSTDTSGGKINIPNIYSIENSRYYNPDSSPSGEWILKLKDARYSRDFASIVMIPSGWIVDKYLKTIDPPVGWIVTANAYGTGGTVCSRSHSGINDTEKLTKTPYKIRAIV